MLNIEIPSFREDAEKVVCAVPVVKQYKKVSLDFNKFNEQQNFNGRIF